MRRASLSRARCSFGSTFASAGRAVAPDAAGRGLTACTIVIGAPSRVRQPLSFASLADSVSVYSTGLPGQRYTVLPSACAQLIGAASHTSITAAHNPEFKRFMHLAPVPTTRSGVVEMTPIVAPKQKGPALPAPSVLLSVGAYSE